MKLDISLLKAPEQLAAKGYRFPAYDVEAMREVTRRQPRWAHFGPGNIFRAFIARVHQQLLDSGDFSSGIIAFNTIPDPGDTDYIRTAYTEHDNLCVSVSLKADGNMEKTVVGSVAEAYNVVKDDGFARAKEVFTDEGFMMASFTITEKGYARPSYATDMTSSPEDAKTLMGRVTYMLKLRMEACGAPMTLLSLDNCSQNGNKLKGAIMELAHSWNDAALIKYIEEKVSFPWSMIDKITPGPDSRVLEMLEADGIEGIPHGSAAVPFVNAEEKEYLVIEDNFPNGRPPLEKAGLYFADRDTVNAVEKMKVTVCLNPLHTALAVYGCVLGYDVIWKEISDPELKKLIMKLGYDEGLKVAVDPGIFTPRHFLDEVVNDRLPNSFLPDTPQRIATDTSHKVAIRFGETVRSYMETFGSAAELVALPLAIAGWLRYLEGVDDSGAPFTLSPDPRLEDLVKREPADILADETIFGVDLKKAGLFDKIMGYLSEMRQGPGSVRATLKKYLG